MHSPPLVSAVILTHCERTALNTLLCIAALEKQTISDQIEILVVDNGSHDPSVGILRNRLKGKLHVRILEAPKNLGFGAGNDIAIPQAQGKFILILNPDTHLLPDALEKMVKELERDPKIGIVGPKLMHDDGSVRESARTFPGVLDVVGKRTMLKHLMPGRMRKYLGNDANRNEARDTDWIVGGCMLIPTDLLHKIGSFDHRFFLFFEDIDLCRRVWEVDRTVRYLPSAVALDGKKRLSEGGLWQLLTTPTGRSHIASMLRYFAKWGLN